MPKNYFPGQTFVGKEFDSRIFPEGEYFQCIFEHCHFSKADLSHYHFEQCQFVHCDLSLAILGKTAFQDVQFDHCKMLGLRFEDCSAILLSFSASDCQLDFSSFSRQKLRETVFRRCRMWEVDLGEADFSQSVFDHCDLKGAIFDRTNLTKADLSSAYHFQINPGINTLKKAKFSKENVIGLLGNLGIEIV